MYKNKKPHEEHGASGVELFALCYWFSSQEMLWDARITLDTVEGATAFQAPFVVFLAVSIWVFCLCLIVFIGTRFGANTNIIVTRPEARDFSVALTALQEFGGIFAHRLNVLFCFSGVIGKNLVCEIRVSLVHS